MTPPPLCILPARYHSTRLPGKMLRMLDGETLIERAYRRAVGIFGDTETVVAIPASDASGPLGDELRRIGATIFAWDGPESDVLGRFHACAHRYRWHPESILHRWTSDDPFKRAPDVFAVLDGERRPVEWGGEAFTLAMLDAAHIRLGESSTGREHMTFALFPTLPPAVPTSGTWTIDTEQDLADARAMLAQRDAA
jgi:spore coat polysaccharide biosynthesis protein SpsF (cytidylyltransferase family)